ncbi:radical SAM/SPASM domain-containing protein [Clostridium saccharoperbutylacetonicum]|uniref:radical SAM/SPASM domain-containing protein n=1 Tax=Clostridium saccharoperbutylacetonicum TaxID=36745 RepID=UPI0039EC0942
MDTLFIELTHRCNLKCTFCYRHKVEEKNDMSIETCIKILNEAKMIGIKSIAFNGYGENILHKDFISALKYASENFDKVHFNTNGLALNDELCNEILKINLDHIVFSVTGFNFEVYNEFQGSGLNNKIIIKNVYENILNFIEKRDSQKGKVKIFMQYIMTDKSRQDILKYIDFWKDKVDDINITYLNSIFDEVSSFNKKAVSSGKQKCPQIGKVLLVHSGGDVSLCCSDCFKGTSIGNVNEFPLNKLVSSDKFRYIEKVNDKLEIDKLPMICQKCDEIYENLFYDIQCKYSEIKEYIESIKKLKNEKLALFGVNTNMNKFLYALKIYSNNEEFIIVDNYKNGFYENKPILKPNKDILKERKVIVFADNKYNEIQSCLQNIEIRCVSHKQLVRK